MISVLVHLDRISLFHTMEPFFSPRFRKMFTITGSLRWCLERDRNRVLFMERWFKNDRPPDLEVMRRLRDKYDTIVFLDGYAAAGTHLLELLPFVDHFFHKSVFADRSNYRKKLYAKRLFADYFHREFGIADSSPEYLPDLSLSEEEAGRIELSWNIGPGDYPRRHRIQRTGVLAARAIGPDLGRLFRSGNDRPPADFSGASRRVPVHARIGLVSSETVTHQRLLALEQMKGNPDFVTGSVPQNLYYRELEESKIVFSPFGWGEVCFRDFEAVKAGAMLLKPDMSHLRTWPDIYIPWETYVPLAWDCSDLTEKAGRYLSDDAERSRIARNGWEQYRSQLAAMDERFESILSKIL
jgi:hypothetical protein